MANNKLLTLGYNYFDFDFDCGRLSLFFILLSALPGGPKQKTPKSLLAVHRLLTAAANLHIINCMKTVVV